MKLAPDDRTSRFTRGFAYLKKGELDKAMADFNEVLRRDPEFGEAYRERGHALAFKGELDKALADLNKAIEMVPDDYEAFFCRGDAYARKGELDKAIADYDQAIKLDPAFAEAYFNRALALCGQERLREGLGRLQASDRARPANGRGLQKLGPGRKTSRRGPRPSIGWRRCC